MWKHRRNDLIFFKIQHADVVRWPLDEFIVCLKLLLIKYVYDNLINDFSIFGQQIGIFTNITFKFITSEATRKFWKHHILFFIISIKFVSHQVLISGFSMLLLLSLIPVASYGRLLHNHSLIACKSFSLRCLSPHSLIKQRKCGITIIKTILLARNYNYSAKQWNPKLVLHIT